MYIDEDIINYDYIKSNIDIVQNKLSQFNYKVKTIKSKENNINDLDKRNILNLFIR